MNYRTILSNGRRAMFGGLLALSLTACVDVATTGQSSGGVDGPKLNPNRTVKVALLVPSGSGNANQENLANNLIRAAEMAIADHPNAKIDMRVYATHGNATQATSAAQAAISDGAKIIIGPLFAESANAVGKVAAAKNINVLSFSNNTGVAGGNVFVLGNSFQNTANRIVGYASAKGYKSVAVVSPQNAAGTAAAAAVKSAASRTGARFALSNPGLRGGWFTIPDGAAISAFNGRFNNTYGTAPHPLAGIAYDGMKAFAELRSNKNPGAAQRSQLSRAQGFRGASGTFRLLKNGSTQRALSVAEASAGGLRVISSAPTKFGGSGS